MSMIPYSANEFDRNWTCNDALEMTDAAYRKRMYLIDKGGSDWGPACHVEDLVRG